MTANPLTDVLKPLSFALAAPIAILAAAAPARALEITTAPEDYVFVNDANPDKGYRDLMVQTIIVRNDEDAPVTLKSLQIDVYGEGAELVTKAVPVDRAVAQSRDFAGMAAHGLSVFLNAQIMDEKGLGDAFGEGTTLAESARLAPDEALILTSQYFAVDFEPKSVSIIAGFETEGGKIKTVRRDLSARRRAQKIAYAAPLDGNWMMRSFANVYSHHRFIPSNEFALDFFKPGPGGALDHGVKRDAEDDYGYGEPVHAVADGEVVFVITGEVQNPDALSKHDDETVEEARKRVRQYQMRRFAQNFRAAAAGNFIVLKHVENGVTEYSSYGHLKTGSVAVKVGDHVRQGDVIAEVGNTGDSTLTHLHFQVNSGPDAFYSRSLPVSFTNQKSLYIGQDPGLVVKFGD